MKEVIKQIQELRCKSYAQAKGQYSSFYSGEIAEKFGVDVTNIKIKK